MIYPLTDDVELVIERGIPLLYLKHTGGAIALADANAVIDLAHALELLTEDWKLTGGKPDWTTA